MAQKVKFKMFPKLANTMHLILKGYINRYNIFAKITYFDY